MGASKVEVRNESESKFRKLKRYITVEPVSLAVNVPYCLLVICLQNLTLEKACRVNLGFPDLVCDNMMDKAMNNINCGKVSEREESLMFARNAFTSESISSISTYPNMYERENDSFSVNRANHEFEMEVCRAERESQKLGSTLRAYVAPFVSAIGIVLILFWGNWSDKSGKRKPCILVSHIGESLGQLVALIGAIFMKQLPVEFTVILGALFPAIGGSWPLMAIGLFSYLAEITEEKDRVFRFGILYQLYPIITICTLPFSGILYLKLGYIKLISICMLINFAGALYIIFVLDEIKPRVKEDIEEQLPETELTDMLTVAKSPEHSTTAPIESISNTTGNICLNSIKDIVMVVVRKRNGNGRKIVCMTLAICGLAQVLEYEYENEYYFVRTKLNWEALEEAPFAAYVSLTSFVGNTLMITVASKYLKVSDTILAIISSSLTAVSRLVCITVTTTVMLYVAKTIDIFYGIPSLIVRSVVSTVVDNTEIGKIYSMMGVLENLSQFIFVPIYSSIYRYTVDSFPNAYFICSLAVITIVMILCWVLYYWVKAHQGTDEVMDSQLTDKERQNYAAAPCSQIESDSDG